jgi:8-oxo-dGTP pyrophosphatase MutT (NUDIX family)
VATTAVVAEILIAGLEASAWVSLLVLAIFGTDWIDLSALDSWQALVTIVVLAAAYVLGILVDRAADSLHNKLGDWRAPRPVDKPAGIPRMRMVVLREGGAISTFVDYQRSRLRVARATVLNLLLALPVAVGFLLARTDAGWWTAAAAALIAVSALLAELACRRIDYAYVTRLSDAYRLVKKIKRSDLAAAVPWKVTDGGKLELLLVRTRGGKRWTFPKGHRKKKESLAEAARREAREEAGVRGPIDERCLVEYAYPPGSRPGRTEDYRVAAFLLEVREDGLRREGDDASRALAWADPDEARALLEEGRQGDERRYADEMKRVVGAAVEAIEPEVE